MWEPGSTFHQAGVREHIPLEQGLRQLVLFYARQPISSVREHIPLEQGLRLRRRFNLAHLRVVREHIPLEQGLRRSDSHCHFI